MTIVQAVKKEGIKLSYGDQYARWNKTDKRR